MKTNIIKVSAMKKACAIIAVLALSLCFLGCSSSSSSGSGGETSSTKSAADTSSPTNLTLDETGYSVTSSGYVKYGFKMSNPNNNYMAQYPVISITGKAADGSIIFADKQTMMKIYSGETISYGGQAGNGTPPTTVEFTISVDDRNWKKTTDTRSDLYTISAPNVVVGQYGNTSFTGQIALNKEDDSATKPAVTVLLRDGAGKIVYGQTTYVSTALSVGAPQAFELSIYKPPEYANYEISATPWM